MTMTHDDAGLRELAERVITDAELAPRSVAEVTALPSFASRIAECERLCGRPYSELAHEVQDAVVLRRLRQLVNTVRLNPVWRDRLGSVGALHGYDEWQAVPIADRDDQRELFMGTRPGMVVPIEHGGFEVVASGGTSGGLPLEIVYPLRELRDTYRIAGRFMGTHQLGRHLFGSEPRWLFTNLADYQMWSSGTMVGGVLQSVPDVNYIGAGPVTAPVLEHMFSYPGPKALMGISAGIAILTDLGAGMPQRSRESFRVALYGSGVLPQRNRAELKAMYPNLTILSYFAATQAETIGLQLDEETPYLATVPGLHLVEIVDEAGRWVGEGEEGELVVTRLHGHEAPLLRLKLGDRMIRRPALDGPGLRTQRLEFAGRTGDVLHLNDSQYSAPRAFAAVADRLRYTLGVDLAQAAHEIQFVNHREAKTITLLLALDDPQGTQYAVDAALGPGGVQRVFTEALPRSLSLFNDREATPDSIERTGYGFQLVLVHRGSAEIERTAVGKVPLVRDRG